MERDESCEYGKYCAVCSCLISDLCGGKKSSHCENFPTIKIFLGFKSSVAIKHSSFCVYARRQSSKTTMRHQMWNPFLFHLVLRLYHRILNTASMLSKMKSGFSFSSSAFECRPEVKPIVFTPALLPWIISCGVSPQ
jgi:hypothetical protein